MRAPIPANEEARLAALESHALLDSAPERAFDDIAKLAQVICRTPMAMVSLVAEDRQWFKARCGFAAQETPRDASFCAHALDRRAPLVVADTTVDPRFADNPLVTADPNIRFYAGVPIFVEEGVAMGTLCVLDKVPRTLDDTQLDALTALARRVEIEMRLRKESLNARRAASAPSDATATRSLELPGGATVAGRYRIEREIGLGGMGRVYRALDTTRDQRVALKIMSALAASETDAARTSSPRSRTP